MVDMTIEFPDGQQIKTNTAQLKAATKKLRKMDTAKDVAGITGQRLLSFIERIERLREEQSALKEDEKEVFAEAKGTGFDTKTIRKLIKLRKMEAEERREQAELLDLYATAIGLQYTLAV